MPNMFSVQKFSDAAFQSYSIYMKETEDSWQALKMSPRLIQSQPWVFNQARALVGWLLELRVI